MKKRLFMNPNLIKTKFRGGEGGGRLNLYSLCGPDPNYFNYA